MPGHVRPLRATRPLRSSAADLAMLQRVGSIGMWWWDPGRGEPRWSDEMFRLLGRPRGLGPASLDEIESIFAPASAQRLREAAQRALAEGKGSAIELELAGGQRWVSATAEVVRSRGVVVGLRGVMQDITERRSREAANNELREDLARAQRIARLGSWTYDVSTGGMRWSDGLFLVLGLDPREGVPPLDVAIATLSPRSQEQVRAALDLAIHGGSYELEVELLDGRRLEVRGEPVLGPQGDVVSVRGIARGVTQERLVLDALRASERRLAEAQKVARIGSWEYDLVRGVETWSAELYRLAGIPMDSARPGPDALLSTLTPESAEQVRRLARAARTQGRGFCLDVELARPIDRTQFLGLRCEAVRGPEGNVVALRGTVQDITARRLAEEALRRSERLGTLGLLVAGIAHEINNPLTYIRGNIDMLRAVAGDAAATPQGADLATMLGEIQECARVATQGLERIAAITQGLRLVSRPSSGVRKDADVNELARQVLEVARPKLGPGVAVETRLEARSRAPIDDRQIGQVLLNLLLNAADAVKGHADGAIVLATREREDAIEISVTDNGPGIPPEVRRRLFTPFFTTKPEGTGLGLSVSQAIVKAHDGTLRVRSSEGHGATFQITLPLRGALHRRSYEK